MAKAPQSIGKYTVIEQIATGGMGAVYTAEHPTLDRKVIIKKLTLRGDASIRERFRREARIMMDFQNDYIAAVYDHFREGSYYHIVLEYIDGLSLEQLVERERYLPEEIALRVMRDCCLALEYAHRHNVVHRDIKPSNILISKSGRVKIVDFGIASVYGEEESNLTREGMTLGTPNYMAPEQFHNTRGVDLRADIYSLGVTLYEALTGKRPFSGGMSAEAIQRIQRGRYPKPRAVNPLVSRFCARLIRRLMHRKPARRPRSLHAVRRKIERRLQRISPVAGAKRDAAHETRLSEFLDGAWVRSVPQSLARRALPAGIAVLMLAAVGGGVAGWRLGVHHDLFAGDEYGALTFSLRVPRDGPQFEELGIRATIFREHDGTTSDLMKVASAFYREGHRYPRWATRLFTEDVVLYRDEERESRTHLALKSPRLHLPAGTYQVRVRAGDKTIWNDISLDSRAVQLQHPRTVDAQSLLFMIRSWEENELDITISARDAENGTTIPVSEIEYRTAGRWRALDEIEAIYSGNRHRFRVHADGYQSRDVTIESNPTERSVAVDVRLTTE